MADETSSERRDGSRSYLETSVPVRVALGVEGAFAPTLNGMLLDEGPGGVSLVVVANGDVPDGTPIRFRSEHDTDATPVMVRWRRRLDDRILRLGCEFMPPAEVEG